ncbi:pentapeptide MXKDX repeat protein [Phyllobacterium endophyticum]|uniref:Pentapeptide MXKDX repeat protein n=1 Tax=Phyllobacterium endophyticum TaxID=1149773 RepID=A0A2P7AL75_9HYPH|nr:pentapeptide MXKDX repeat protein [Phyllobacterium endophyticum]MBB3233317.1 pentapeptide MXKDX repeat protein [Phyllobacterium endophyticum]PSH54944.1 pentapeptide MXKDX repeat protein [Phyllobacterium endophyticum]TXR47602.1 pentapeptide MXKDX repeat protein [Phyllobacterium endophyticum]TYR43327.1 pentapeptide MXKDX repeat protein [Phyllobacterium endophyticum]
MNIITRAVALSAFVLATGFAGSNIASAMDANKPMTKADCMKHAGMEKDAMKKDSMMKECDTMAMKKDSMSSSSMKKDAAKPDAMGTMAPKKKTTN